MRLLRLFAAHFLPIALDPGGTHGRKKAQKAQNNESEEREVAGIGGVFPRFRVAEGRRGRDGWGMMKEATIKIVGARQHNLQNLTVEFPRHRLVVVTGVSGSGKSSLAFNTLYAEGQRRYVESLSASAQQYLEKMEKPDVDFIDGLSPAIAIAQLTAQQNPRSTIATATEIYDYLRVLYATCGQPHDPATGQPVERHTTQSIVDAVLAWPENARVLLLAPLQASEVMQPKKLWEKLSRQGFVRVRVRGEIYEIEDQPAVKEGEAVDIVIDRLVLRAENRNRLVESVTVALRWSGSQSTVVALRQTEEGWAERKFTTLYLNPVTGFRMPPLTPKHFSFNSHHGACAECQGLGVRMHGDPALLVPDAAKSLSEGAVKTWWGKNPKLKVLHDRQIAALVAHFSVNEKAAFSELPENFRDALFHGLPTGLKVNGKAKAWEGLVPQATRLLEESESEFMKLNVRRFMNPTLCAACGGQRLKKEILAVTLASSAQALSIIGCTALTISGARRWLGELELTARQQTIATDVLRELHERLGFLENVGLGYLTLDRANSTLSGGEAQRIRLASQLGSRLSGVLYVLDEPSIGLHQRDNDRLISTLHDLRDRGNSVIVVEHDEDTIRAADYVLDLGPGAGPHGGHLTAQGTPAEIERNVNSLTGRFLSGAETIKPPAKRIVPGKDWLTVHGATEHTLKNIDVAFPLGCFICVTGVSGSGKSTLVDDILRRELFRKFYHAKDPPGAHRSMSGLSLIDKAIVIDQSPIGRNPRSNPATFVGAFTGIRDLYAQLPSAKVRGYNAGTFSFNTKGGRCEVCEGDGQIQIDMHFMTDVYVTCDACEGRRYKPDVLEVLYKGQSIADVLEMNLDQAAEFFRAIPGLSDKLRTLCQVGLGYLKLGQAANTLSGGEAQRIKLSGELAKRSTGRTLYLLDEPTTGLHFADIETLLRVLFGLRDQGNTLIVIEHNLDVIKCADWVIDLGPEGGQAGGEIVVAGPPEVVAACPQSYTGRYLKKKLDPSIAPAKAKRKRRIIPALFSG